MSRAPSAPPPEPDGLRLAFLCDHPQHAPTLARWHAAEWADLEPAWTEEANLRELRSHTGRLVIPTTVIALEGGVLRGSASLLEEDLASLSGRGPWLASVYVAEEARGRGLGRSLVREIERVASRLRVKQLYLFTTHEEAWYRGLGWERVEGRSHRGQAITLMRRDLEGSGGVSP